jgi:hypothetical protein
MHANVKRLLMSGSVRGLGGAAAVMLLLLAAGSIDANAQLRGLPAVGGIGGGGGGIGGGLPNLPNLPGVPGADGLAGGGLPSVPDNTVKFGISIPTNFGSVPLPATPVPDVVGTVKNVGNGLTGTIANTTGALGGGINQTAGAARSALARGSGVPPTGEHRYVSKEVVVSLPSSLTPQALNALAARHQLTHIESHNIGLTATTIHRWRIADGRSVPDVIRALERDGGVRAAQPNYRYTLQQNEGTQPSEIEALQYSLAKLHLAQAHRISTGAQVLVAVIDSGIDISHPEIAGMVAESFDAVPAEESADRHGTAMAGTIIAHVRLKGVAPGARLLAVRAFAVSGSTADGTTLNIARGIDWAVAHGARVINMSFAGPNDPGLARVLAAARKKGVVLVAAAGNAGPKSPPLYPAADPNVIAVTATDAQDKLLAVAVHGRHIAVAAPGVDILGPAPGGGFQMSTGTSIAAAQVSGIAALLLERSRDITPDAVRKALVASALPLGPKGRADQFGAGLVDAYRAIQSLPAATVRARPEEVSAAR